MYQALLRHLGYLSVKKKKTARILVPIGLKF